MRRRSGWNVSLDNGAIHDPSVTQDHEDGESYSALRKFFRQYELYYVVADERHVARGR